MGNILFFFLNFFLQEVMAKLLFPANFASRLSDRFNCSMILGELITNTLHDSIYIYTSPDVPDSFYNISVWLTWNCTKSVTFQQTDRCQTNNINHSTKSRQYKNFHVYIIMHWCILFYVNQTFKTLIQKILECVMEWPKHISIQLSHAGIHEYKDITSNVIGWFAEVVIMRLACM